MNKYIDKKATENKMKQVAPSNNVVPLHKHLDESHIKSAEEAIEAAKTARIDLSNDIAEIATEQLMGWLSSYGTMTNENRVDFRDVMMIEQAINAALFRYYGLDHPMHEVTEDAFSDNDEYKEE